MTPKERAYAMYDLAEKWNEGELSDAAFMDWMTSLLEAPVELSYAEFLARATA